MQSLRGKRLVCATRELAPGEAISFEGIVRGEERPCFALRLPGSGSGAGTFVAYLNVCAHRNQPVVVDRQPLDGAALLECRAHGALYEPGTGVCIEGPCEGARLVPVMVEVEDDQVYALDDDQVDDSLYDQPD